MARIAPRQFTTWALRPPHDPTRGYRIYHEQASAGLLVEELRLETEVADQGRSLFGGALRTQNRLWREFRNYSRQAQSNMQTGLSSPDRSACLLYYYALLNYAKAELLTTNPNDILGQKIRHGLSFDPTTANTVRGDYLTVHGSGVFPLLYRKRTGQALSPGTRLPVKRLLGQVPEIGTQVTATNIGEPQVSGLLHLVGSDNEFAWTVVAIFSESLKGNAATRGEVQKTFHELDPDGYRPGWRDIFAVSRRAGFPLAFYELSDKVPLASEDPTDQDRAVAMVEATKRTWDALRPWLSISTDPLWDAWFCPSLFKTPRLKLILPTSLARYALMFYASSLVRYRPAMFDPQLHPDQALIFDAVARESGVPILQDVLSSIRRLPHLFWSRDTLRS